MSPHSPKLPEKKPAPAPAQMDGLDWARESVGLKAVTVGKDRFSVEINGNDLDLLIQHRRGDPARQQALKDAEEIREALLCSDVRHREHLDAMSRLMDYLIAPGRIPVETARDRALARVQESETVDLMADEPALKPAEMAPKKLTENQQRVVDRLHQDGYRIFANESGTYSGLSKSGGTTINQEALKRHMVAQCGGVFDLYTPCDHALEDNTIRVLVRRIAELEGAGSSSHRSLHQAVSLIDDIASTAAPNESTLSRIQAIARNAYLSHQPPAIPEEDFLGEKLHWREDDNHWVFLDQNKNPFWFAAFASAEDAKAAMGEWKQIASTLLAIHEDWEAYKPGGNRRPEALWASARSLDGISLKMELKEGPGSTCQLASPGDKPFWNARFEDKESALAFHSRLSWALTTIRRVLGSWNQDADARGSHAHEVRGCLRRLGLLNDQPAD